MPDKTKAPTIRFTDFTDAWEQRKLSELAEFSKGQGYSKGDLCESGTPIILYGRLYTKYETVISKVDTFVTEKVKSVFSKGGEVIVPSSGETAEDISRASVVENAGIILGGDLNVLKPKPEIAPAFLAITISNGTQQKELSKRAQGKSVVHIHNSDLQEVMLVYPKLNEQQKICSLFGAFDNLITLHQREYDKTVNVKKAMLEKMFPKEGENKPEIRFAGFTDAWEQRKLGDIAVIIMGQSPSSTNYTDNPADHILVQGNADMKNGHVTPRVWTTQITKEAKKGDLILSVRAPVGDVGKTDYPVVLGRGVAAIRGKEFLYQALTKMKQDGFWDKLSTGSTFDSINSTDIKESIVAVPASDEQDRIGDFLGNLDHLITLHQRELEKLQNMKKALLEKMFV